MTQLYLTMPQPGETITEGTIVQWLVKEGVTVDEHAPVAELETEKAVFEYESPFVGKIVKILHADGTRVKVAEPIAIMDVPNDKANFYIMMGIAKTVDGAATAPTSVAAKSTAVTAPQAESVQTRTPSSVDLKMSPYVRKQAVQFGVTESQLSDLAKKSADGRITKDMIDAFVSGKPVVAPSRSTQDSGSVDSRLSTTVQQGDVRIEKCSAIRMRIADNMVLSKSKIPHAHNGIAVDVTHVVNYREANKQRFKDKHGLNLNFLTLIYPALVKAIKAYPMINASYDDSTNPHQIKYFNKINLGVAAGTSQGLVIPVIPDIESLSTKDFNSMVSDRLARAEAKKLKPDELMGATLIFNNYGFFGTNLGVQVIQYPMAATLGMSAIEKRVVPVGDAIGVRTMCDFVLSFDHRVMDGRETGLFLKMLKDGVEALQFSHVG